MTRIIDGRDAGAFITAALDDFGLDPYAFRLYARIVRRAGTKQGCFESIDSMAKACRVNRDTVYKALKLLVEHRLIEKEPHIGRPSSYFLTPPSEWIPLADPSQIRDTEPIPNSGHHLSQIRDTPIPKTGYPPIPNLGHKGINKRDQKKDQQEGGKKPVADDGLIDPFYNGFQKAIAKEIQRNQNGPKNFITDSPWGNLAEEMRQDPEAVWLTWKNHLLMLYGDKKDPESYVGKICNEIYQNPGSELNCKPWIEFADFFRKNLSAPPPPQKRPPRQPQITQIPDRNLSRIAIKEARRVINPPA